MKISYYDLLGMVKEGNAPERIEVSLTSGTTEIYKAEYDAGEFNYYLLQRDLQNENYRFYLSECFLESSMFDKCITILDKEERIEDFEVLIPSEYQYSQCPSWKDKEEVIRFMNCNFNAHQRAIRDIINNQKKIIDKLKELEM